MGSCSFVDIGKVIIMTLPGNPQDSLSSSSHKTFKYLVVEHPINMRYTILTLISLFFISPVSALITNNTANPAYYSNGVTLISGSFINQAGYLPVEMVYFIAVLGIIFWICSMVSPICEDIFCLITPVPFAIAAWYAAYMTRDQMTIVVNNGVIYPVSTQIITPDPTLQIVMTACLVLSILSGIYIVFLRDTDKKLANERQPNEY